MEEEATYTDQLVLLLAYRGEHFSGFQAQTGQRTVAGELSFALRTLLKRDCELTCAGRTDAGVHAYGQVVNTPVGEAERARIEETRFARSLNAILPQDVHVRACTFADVGFSARFDAVDRTYVYRIARGEPSVFAPHMSTFVRDALDVDAMKKAAELLVGEHDFTSFCKTASSEGKNCVRRLDKVELVRTQHFGENYLELWVRGTAFLHNMIRIIVGTLIEVGRGARSVKSVSEALAACDRRQAGPTAPPEGLVFQEIRYPKEMHLFEGVLN